ncbi:hypothetical protein BDV10DRAFT_166393 [Aspergillus recurvatus]
MTRKQRLRSEGKAEKAKVARGILILNCATSATVSGHAQSGIFGARPRRLKPDHPYIALSATGFASTRTAVAGSRLAVLGLRAYENAPGTGAKTR